MPAANPDTYTGRPGRPVHAGKTDPLANAPAPPPPPPPPGPGSTVTTFAVDSRLNTPQTVVPVTFGQPFVQGHWDPANNLFARIGATAIPIQADEIALHVDGSVRFAVLSAEIPSLAANETQNIELYTSADAPQSAPTLSVPADWDLRCDALVHRNQITRVRFTDGVTGGYQVGDTVTVRVTYGSVVEDFTSAPLTQAEIGAGKTISPSGGTSGPGTKVAEKIQAAMLASPTFDGYRLGTGKGYENIRIRLRDAAGGAFTVQVIHTTQAVITISNDMEYGGPPVLYTANFRAALLEAVSGANANSEQPSRRMHGRVATEFIINQPFTAAGGAVHPHLMARAAIRLMRGGTLIKSDITFEQAWLLVPNQRQLTYSMTISNGATVLYFQPQFPHYYSSRWHTAVWYGTPPNVRHRHAMRYFVDSRAIYPYDLGITVAETALASAYNEMVSRRAAQWPRWGPMSWINLQPLMGTTGGRPDIGPIPRWYAMYLLSQDDRLREVMLANADAAGAAPIHFRNEATDLIVDVESFPLISQLHTSSPTLVNRPDPTDWGPDNEHQASFAYLPYLVTGDYYYLEETQFWAAWSVMRLNAGYRSYGLGLVQRQPVRAQAWPLRNICDAARVTSEGHPLKGFFTRIMASNLAWYAENYRDGTSNPDIHPMGSMAHSTTSTSTWQNDFFSIVMGLQALNNIPNARPILDFLTRFTVGRVNSPDLCYRNAAGNYWPTKTNGVFHTTWAQWQAAGYPDADIAACSTSVVQHNPEMTYTYPAIMLGMLGIMNHVGVDGAAEAWTRYRPIVTGKFENDPTWALVPPTSQV